MANVPEMMDAAEALLQLHCHSRIFPMPSRNQAEITTVTPNDKTKDKPPTKIPVQNGFTPTSSPSSQFDDTPCRPLPPTNVEKRLNLHQKYLQELRRWQKTTKTVQVINGLQEMTIKPKKLDHPSTSHSKKVKETRNKATQTENCCVSTEFIESQTKIRDLCHMVKKLKKELATVNKIRVHCDSNRNNAREKTFLSRNRRTRRTNTSSNSFTLPSDDSDGDSKSKSEEEINDDTMDTSYVPKDESMADDREKTPNNAAVAKDMIPIGDGNAIVPSRVLRQLDWSSYTNVTRKLLTAVFPRRVLATHSLTGKPSPAFPNKPAKKKLNPALVNDIVQTVVERCRVQESMVRTSITTKCADESKMLRSRQKNNSKSNIKENIAPESEDSFEKKIKIKLALRFDQYFD